MNLLSTFILFVEDNNKSNPPILAIILAIVFVVSICATFISFLIKAEKFHRSDLGKKTLDYIIKNKGISEKEYKNEFPDSKIKFSRAARYLMMVGGIIGDYSYERSKGLIIPKIKINYSQKEKAMGLNTQLPYIEDEKFINLIEQKNLFLENERITKIIDNYLKQNKISISELEISSILFRVRPLILGIYTHIEDDDYAQFLSKIYYFSNTSFSTYQILKHRKNIQVSDTYIKMYQLFEMLAQQNQIVTDEEKRVMSFIALCYVAYIIDRNRLCETRKKIFEEYEIDLDNSLSEGIIKLNKICGEDALITMYTLYYSEKNNCTYLSCKSKCINEVKNILKNQRQKEELDNLLNGKINVREYTISDTDLMRGEDFEKFVMGVLQKHGFSCSLTKKAADQGVDIIATKELEKVAVQCKRYDGTVGNHAIMEAVAGAKYYRCNKVLVVTNNYFTKSAKELAKANNVSLWDRDELKARL